MDQHVSTTRHCFPTSIQRRLNHQDRHWGDKAETREGMRHKQNGLAGLMHNRYSKDILPSSCLSRRAVLHGIVFQRQPPRITVTHTVEDIMRTATLIMGSSERIPTNEFALIDLQVLGTETPSIFADVEVAVSSAEEPTSLAAAYRAKKADPSDITFTSAAAYPQGRPVQLPLHGKEVRPGKAQRQQPIGEQQLARMPVEPPRTEWSCELGR